MSAILKYDTGPLNWVRNDIEAALQAALGRVQAFTADSDLTNALRLARDDAHQVMGALTWWASKARQRSHRPWK